MAPMEKKDLQKYLDGLDLSRPPGGITPEEYRRDLEAYYINLFELDVPPLAFFLSSGVVETM